MKAELTRADRLLIRVCLGAPGYALLLLSGLCATMAASLLVPASLAVVTNAVLTHADAARAAVRLVSLLIAGSLGTLAVSFGGAALFSHNASWLGRRLLRQAISLGPRGQEAFPPGDIASRLLDNVPAAAQAGVNALEIVFSIVTSLGAVTALGLTDWRLGAAFLVSAIPMLLAARPSMRGASDVFLEYQRAQGLIAARLGEALGGIRTIQSSGTIGREVQRVLRPLPALAAAGRRTWAVQQRIAWRSALCFALMELTVLGTAGWLVAAGRLSPGGWLATAGYTTLALGIFQSIDAVLAIAHARAAATRVAEVLGTPAARADGTARLADARGHLAFRGVTVRSGDHLLLDGVDLCVPAGSTAAIVGRSGAGKTTLAALVGRLAEPDAGDVLLDGAAVSSLRPDDLHQAVTYAFAQPACLGKTVAEDIGYGPRPVDRTAIEAAARAARAHDFIQRLPHGYDTPMSGTQLSGGERQRLGIARAIAANARVLVLDDATSSLDTATEAQVNEALQELRADKTTLVVAHRAATAPRADTVIWLDGGRVRAMGPHHQLWPDPDYRAVFGAQAHDDQAAPGGSL
jgi:ATP-binding cassette, subfamily B, bacterial